MLCRQEQGISILHCVPHQETQLWNFTKEDKCQFALLDPLIVHQSGKGMTQDKQRIYLHGGGGYPIPIRALYVWEHIMRVGSLFPFSSLWQQTFSSDQQA